MKKVFKKILKVFMWILIVIAALVVLLLAVRFIGKKINSRTPKNGINENMYIDVNGQQQWISIYGENKDNPIMLYLHGGPGYSTSFADWAITRKLAGDYTVISWDQRDCAKTWIKDAKKEIVTADMMRSDLEVVADYVLEYLDKDSLTFLGISWGTYYGCDYAYSHPDKVDCIINLSQVVDNELGWLGEKEDLLKKTENDAEAHKLAEEYDPLLFYNLTEEQLADFDALQKAAPEERPQILENNAWLKDFMQKMSRQVQIKTALNEKYGVPEEGISTSDMNLVAAVFFNPYYSLSELVTVLSYEDKNSFTIERQKDFYTSYTLKDKTVYEMPFYVMQGDIDDPNDVVKNYMESITAPDKEYRRVEGGHMSTLLKSERLAAFVHEIAEKNKENTDGHL
ncbi:MAG: alpha/beta fold hydrolase [Acutalibacteraceae bacterium]|nr:alpha/beta fold hydrolase [Acutalibacteraceae bacterium]